MRALKSGALGAFHLLDEFAKQGPASVISMPLSSIRRVMHASAKLPVFVCGIVALLSLAIASAAPSVTALPQLTYDPSKVANPSATLPAGATRYAGVRGDLSVSEMGTANYEIPLEVIPGRGGLQPSLSIRYSSTGGNGQLGVGFALTGLSQISRCARTVADEGVAQGVQLDDTDRFCLNGQKLVLVSGTYGGDGAEYRTLPDSHVRVRSYRPAGTTAKGPSHFIVWTAEGLVQEYGTSGYSQQIGSGNLRTTIGWPITRVTNRSNVVMVYEYQKTESASSGESERWLTAIRYGLSNNLDRQVVFDYDETRTDKAYGWLYGSPRSLTRRLKSITMNLYDSQQGLRRARHYALSYTNTGATGYSKLASVTVCGVASTECKQPTVFTWSPGGSGFQSGDAQTAAVPSSSTSMLISADFNGDGRTDLAYPETSGWKYVIATSNTNNPYGTARDGGDVPLSPGTQTTAYPFDYDLDGRIDLLPRLPIASMWQPLLSRGNDGGVVRAKAHYFSSLNQDRDGESALFGDFDGDGYQDVIEQDLVGTVRRWYWRKRSGTVSPSIDDVEPYDDQAFGAQQEIAALMGALPNWVFVLDVDGDGRDEILRFDFGDMYAVDAVTGAFRTIAGLHSGVVFLDIKLLDLNGDGLTDIVSNGDNASGKVDELYYRLNTGNGFQPPVAMGVNREMLKSSFKAAEVVDVNGDGRDELLIPKYSGFISAGNPQLSGMELVRATYTPAGALSFSVTSTPISFSLRNIDTLTAQGLRVIDAEGDGQDDVLIVDRPTLGNGPAFKLFRHAAGGKPDLLVSIDERSKLPGDPLNVLPVKHKIEYAPLTDASVYTRGDCPRIAHVTCLAGSMYVVKSVRKEAGLHNVTNAELVTEYRYANGRIDKKTRSFLGFAERIARSYALGNSFPATTTVRSFYSNTESRRDPRLRERWTYRRLPNNHLDLERENLTWANKPTIAGSYFDYVSRDERRRYQFLNQACGTSDCLGTMSIAGFEALSVKPFEMHGRISGNVDIYGNELYVSIVDQSINAAGVVENQQQTEITTEFDIDTSQWLIARPKTITTRDSVQDQQSASSISKRRISEFKYPQGASPHAQRPTQHKESSTGSANALTTDFSYDASGNVIGRKTTDASTGTVRETAAVFDPLGYPHAVSNGLGHTSYTGYDPLLGKVKIAVDANGLRTDLTYDTLGNPLKTVLPGGLVKQTAYDLEVGNSETLLRIRSSDNTGAASEVVIDRGGRPVIERFKGFDGAMRTKTRDYLAQGWLNSETTYRRANAAGSPERTTYQYDSYGRLIKTVDPNNASRTWVYDKALVTYTNARGYRKTSAVDARGQTLRIVDAVGTPDETARRQVYGPFGTLLSSQTEGIDASRSTFEYDDRGQMLSRSDKERGTAVYQYNAFGEPSFMRDANGRETTWSYDRIGRVVSRLVHQAGALRSLNQYFYDAYDGREKRGQLMHVGLLDQVAGSQLHKIDYDYDALSRLSRQVHQLPSDINPGTTEALSVDYTYDGLGRLSTLEYPKFPGPLFRVKAIYNYAPADSSNGRLTRINATDPIEPMARTTLWQAVSTDDQDRLVSDRSGDGVETLRAFDWRNLPSGVTMRTASVDANPNRLLLAEHYGYDVEGNLTSRERIDALNESLEQFQYDPLDRVTMATHGSFGTPSDTWSYDKLGNITSSLRRGAYVYDAQRPTQVVAVQGGVFLDRSYAYDAVGNQISRPEGTVLYNDFDLPARIASSRGEVTAGFLYTGNGERARKVTAEGTITYVPGLYERHNTREGIEHRLRISAGNRDVATLSYRERAGTLERQPIRYPHDERQGSMSLVTANDDTANGLKAVVIEQRSYDAFGHLRNPDWSGAFLEGIQPKLLEQGYAGHDDDREFGLVNMKGRMYDTELGRFLTPDPNVDGANASQAWNRYTYVSNNPLRYTDPTGFLACFGCPEEQGGGGASGIPEMMESWAADDDAFFNEGQRGVDPTNPNSQEGSWVQRQADKYTDRVMEKVKELNERDRQAEEAKKMSEARALAQQRAKEAAAKLGSNGGRSAAVNPPLVDSSSGMLACAGLCSPALPVSDQERVTEELARVFRQATILAPITGGTTYATEEQYVRALHEYLQSMEPSIDWNDQWNGPNAGQGQPIDDHHGHGSTHDPSEALDHARHLNRQFNEAGHQWMEQLERNREASHTPYRVTPNGPTYVPIAPRLPITFTR